MPTPGQRNRFPLSILEPCHRYRCKRCGEHLTANHYSLTEADSLRSSNVTCNSCRLSGGVHPGFDREKAGRTEWMDQSSCLRYNPEIFFPVDEELREGRWRPVCASCPVRSPCEAYGRHTRSWGVWGGLPMESGEPREVEYYSSDPEAVLQRLRRASRKAAQRASEGLKDPSGHSGTPEP